jgi:biopolymer transport protein ExbB
MIRVIGWLLLAAPLALFAQDAAAPLAPPQPAPVTAPTVSLEEAYRREFAMLAAQKRELEQRLAQTREAFASDRARIEADINRLESSVLARRTEGDRVAERLAEAERQADLNLDNSELLRATYQQSEATLQGYGLDFMQDEGFTAQDDGAQLAAIFAEANALLARLGTVRREPGVYYLSDGTEVQGELVRIGNIAAYGISPRGSGALAPAGGGRLKLWGEPAEEAAQALARGQAPAPTPIFLYESLNVPVEASKRQTVVEHISEGGTIGWVIVALGLLGALLIVLRALFLQRSGADVERITDRVAGLVRQGKIEEAIDAAKENKGSVARVVTATLRNLDRDREHLEDIVSESILHEHGRLNRFGAMILVIAGVAPLLGLLGTVTGMIQTFDIITEFGTSDPKLLSGGIAVALVTTKLGLTVAIPALLLGSVLSGWAERIKDEMEKVALRITNLGQEARAAKA